MSLTVNDPLQWPKPRVYNHQQCRGREGAARLQWRQTRSPTTNADWHDPAQEWACVCPKLACANVCDARQSIAPVTGYEVQVSGRFEVFDLCKHSDSIAELQVASFQTPINRRTLDAAQSERLPMLGEQCPAVEAKFRRIAVLSTSYWARNGQEREYGRQLRFHLQCQHTNITI